MIVGYGLRNLAKLFPVGKTQIHNIISGKSWSHVA